MFIYVDSYRIVCWEGSVYLFSYIQFFLYVLKICIKRRIGDPYIRRNVGSTKRR